MSTITTKTVLFTTSNGAEFSLTGYHDTLNGTARFDIVGRSNGWTTVLKNAPWGTAYRWFIEDGERSLSGAQNMLRSALPEDGDLIVGNPVKRTSP